MHPYLKQSYRLRYLLNQRKQLVTSGIEEGDARAVEQARVRWQVLGRRCLNKDAQRKQKTEKSYFGPFHFICSSR